VLPDEVGEVENGTLPRRRYFRARDQADLPPVRFHDLRHAFGSTPVKALPISDVQAIGCSSGVQVAVPTGLYSRDPRL
jgi:integrase